MSKLSDIQKKVSNGKVLTNAETIYMMEELQKKSGKTLKDSGDGYGSIVNKLGDANSSTLKWNKNLGNVADTVLKLTNILSNVDLTFIQKTTQSLKLAMEEIIQPIMNIDQALRYEINSKMGITGELARNIRSEMVGVAKDTMVYGVGLEDINSTYIKTISTLGRAIPLSKGLLTDLTLSAKAAGVSFEAAGEFTGNLEGLGIGLVKGPKILTDMSETARSMGLNSMSFIEDATKNLQLVNTLGFKGGIDGFTKIAAKASLIKFDLSLAASKAESLFDPENAIEMAAQLNVLGGDFGRLGNAIDLMFMPTNDMNGFTEQIMEAQKQFVSFNESTQEFESSPLDLRRAREFAKVMGKDVGVVMKEAKSAARRDMIKDKISFMPNMSEEDRELVASLGVLSTDGQVTINGQAIASMDNDELTKSISMLRQEDKNGKMSQIDILREQMNISTAANNYLKSIAFNMGAFGNDGGLFTLFGDDLNDLVYNMTDKTGDVFKSLSKSIENQDVKGIMTILSSNAGLENESLGPLRDFMSKITIPLEQMGINVKDIWGSKVAGKEDGAVTKLKSQENEMRIRNEEKSNTPVQLTVNNSFNGKVQSSDLLKSQTDGVKKRIFDLSSNIPYTYERE